VPYNPDIASVFFRAALLNRGAAASI